MVAEVAGGLLDGLAIGFGGGGGVDVAAMEGEVVGGGEIGYEGGVGIGVGSAEAVMDVSYGEDEADFGCGEDEGAQQGYGVCSSGDSYGEAGAGAEVGAVEVRSSGHKVC